LSEILAVVGVAVALAGCGHGSKPDAPAARPVGGDRDAHGCIPSAGYSWCAHENMCVRPWELAKQQGFENTAEAFRAYCEK
jgi:hypothetical protein